MASFIKMILQIARQLDLIVYYIFYRWKYNIINNQVLFLSQTRNELTGNFEFIYNEMVVHVPMAVHPKVQRVLVLGGGDGGVARELSHYEEIKVIDVVEPDNMFVEVCKQYFPDNACGLDDDRVHIYYQDGLKYLRKCEDMYDLIINDVTEPLGHEAGLFTKEFYGSCYKAHGLPARKPVL